MLGEMMGDSLTITSIMKFANRVFADTQIVSVTGENPRHRTTFGKAFARAGKLANALAKLGCAQGDRIATLAWNDYRHFELYYGISCAGFVCHTINPRLFAEQIIYIANHAEDQWLFVDPDFVPIVEQVQDQLTHVRGYILLCDEANMPQTSLVNAMCYEAIIADEPTEYDWPELDENSASSLCYTSGTTGNPKGVLYSHRSTVLHSMAANATVALSPDEVLLPVVPMFHVNAWGMVYSAAATGTKLVFPGPKMGDGETLSALINEEKVSFALGVPTVWLALVDYLDQSGSTVESLCKVLVGGAACPLSLMKAMDRYNVWMHVVWGMTEMSPLGTYNDLLPWMHELPEEEQYQYRLKAGRLIYGVEMRIVDETGNELAWDGKTSGRLLVRGPWVCKSYYKVKESDAHLPDGWFDTGDVATIDRYGYMQITDRTKDVIKSGGEWISSIDVENAAMGHPDVAEAAVIGVPHPKWTERPLLVVVQRPGSAPDKKDLLNFLIGKIAKWWIPEDCVFVEEIPHTATGKVSKKDLREQFSDYRY
ncbi:MAG: long-chain fatty acid--CoA ligase [Gammaproteobacteria bacterium]|nr:MAG: long-chain fatty acid--CoA ligase [Gammaproteobacteria bacterium]